MLGVGYDRGVPGGAFRDLDGSGAEAGKVPSSGGGSPVVAFTQPPDSLLAVSSVGPGVLDR